MARENEALQGVTAPAQGSVTVSTSDTAVISPMCKGLYVGVGGNVKIRMPDGSTPTYTGMLVGVLYPFQFDMVFATGTSASSIVGVW